MKNRNIKAVANGITNKWIESSEEAIDYLLKKGANLSFIFTRKEMVLKNKILAVNEHGNIFGFNRMPKSVRLDYLNIKNK